MVSLKREIEQRLEYKNSHKEIILLRAFKQKLENSIGRFYYFLNEKSNPDGSIDALDVLTEFEEIFGKRYEEKEFNS